MSRLLRYCYFAIGCFVLFSFTTPEGIRYQHIITDIPQLLVSLQMAIGFLCGCRWQTTDVKLRDDNG